MKKLVLACLAFVATVPSWSTPIAEETLYQRLGGVHPIASVCDAFVDRLLANPKIMGPLSKRVKILPAEGKKRTPGLKYLLTEQICAAAGGPQKYSGRDMRSVHAGMVIDDAQWDAMVDDLTATLTQFKVPAEMQAEIAKLLAPTKRDIVTGENVRMRPNLDRPPTANAPLYDRLGGVYGIALVCDQFVDALLKEPAIGANPKVAESFSKITVPGIKFMLTSQICALTGGPQKYVGRSMKDSHKGLGITAEEWDASGKVFVKTLQKLGVGKTEQDELVAAITKMRKDIVEK
ncbi:MAG: group 1 truncated hemoglobin [Fimbriimonadaceae bacterium]|nr:group 1 truncated hemoglobin [Fimbriimonadaceae bacterium]